MVREWNCDVLYGLAPAAGLIAKAACYQLFVERRSHPIVCTLLFDGRRQSGECRSTGEMTVEAVGSAHPKIIGAVGLVALPLIRHRAFGREVRL